MQPTFLRNLPGDVWWRWTPVIPGYSTASGILGETVHHGLVAEADGHAPREYRHARR